MIQPRPTILFACVVAAGLAACGAPPEPPQGTGRTVGIDWAIFPVEQGTEFGYEREAYWRPDAKTVEAALEAVPAYLRLQWEVELPPGEGDSDIWHEMVWGVREKLPAYKCQVMGIVEDGRRLVYLSFVHYLSFEPDPDDDPDTQPDWTREPYLVDDGGDHYWQAQYDPATGTFVRMDINGEA